MNKVTLFVQKRKQIFLMRHVQAFLLVSRISDLSFSRTDVRPNIVSLKRQILRKMSKRQM